MTLQRSIAVLARTAFAIRVRATTIRFTSPAFHPPTLHRAPSNAGNHRRGVRARMTCLAVALPLVQRSRSMRRAALYFTPALLSPYAACSARRGAHNAFSIIFVHARAARLLPRCYRHSHHAQRLPGLPGGGMGTGVAPALLRLRAYCCWDVTPAADAACSCGCKTLWQRGIPHRHRRITCFRGSSRDMPPPAVVKHTSP